MGPTYRNAAERIQNACDDFQELMTAARDLVGVIHATSLGMSIDGLMDNSTPKEFVDALMDHKVWQTFIDALTEVEDER